MVVLWVLLAVAAFWMAYNYVISAHASKSKTALVLYHVVGAVLIALACVFLLIACMV